MKFVAVRDLRLKPGNVWERLNREGEIVLTSNGKPIALLTRIDEGNLEKAVVAGRRARALMAMEEMQRASLAARADRISNGEIEAEIKAARRSRAR